MDDGSAWRATATATRILAEKRGAAAPTIPAPTFLIIKTLHLYVRPQIPENGMRAPICHSCSHPIFSKKVTRKMYFFLCFFLVSLTDS
jgi:hypothetical protein